MQRYKLQLKVNIIKISGYLGRVGVEPDMIFGSIPAIVLVFKKSVDA